MYYSLKEKLMKRLEGKIGTQYYFKLSKNSRSHRQPPLRLRKRSPKVGLVFCMGGEKEKHCRRGSYAELSNQSLSVCPKKL